MPKKALVLKATEGLKKLSFLRLDEWISKLDSDTPRIRVPTKIPHAGALGLDAVLIQAIVHWSRMNGDGALELYSGANVGRFFATTHGFAAFQVASRFFVNSKPIGLKELSVATAAKATAMRSGNAKHLMNSAKGIGADLFSYGVEEQRYPRSLFGAGDVDRVGPIDAVGSPSHFGNLIRETLTPSLSSQFRELVQDLGYATVELFKNAVEYGHTDQDFSFLPPETDISGVLVRRREVDPKIGSKLLVGQGHEENSPAFYFPKRVISGTKYYLEVTVIDSGPGLACRFLNKPMRQITSAEEGEAVLNCLKKWSTSNKESFRKRGVGLWDVLFHLQRYEGLIRIRSGRSSLFYCFSDRDKHRDLDSVIEKNLKVNQSPNLVGTSVTLVVPLK